MKKLIVKVLVSTLSTMSIYSNIAVAQVTGGSFGGSNWGAGSSSSGSSFRSSGGGFSSSSSPSSSSSSDSSFSSSSDDSELRAELEAMENRYNESQARLVLTQQALRSIEQRQRAELAEARRVDIALESLTPRRFVYQPRSDVCERIHSQNWEARTQCLNYTQTPAMQTSMVVVCDEATTAPQLNRCLGIAARLRFQRSWVGNCRRATRGAGVVEFYNCLETIGERRLPQSEE